MREQAIEVVFLPFEPRRGVKERTNLEDGAGEAKHTLVPFGGSLCGHCVERMALVVVVVERECVENEKTEDSTIEKAMAMRTKVCEQRA